MRVQNVQRAAELRHPRHLLSCTSRVTSTHVADLRRDVIMTFNYSPDNAKLRECSLTSFVLTILPEGRVENVHQAGVLLAGEVDEVHQSEEQQDHGEDGLEDVQDGDGDTLELRVDYILQAMMK